MSVSHTFSHQMSLLWMTHHLYQKAPAFSQTDTPESATAGPSSSVAAATDSLRPGLLSIAVSDPQKHGDGSAAFVSYLIRSRSSLPAFPAAELAVRRRFHDFVSLHKLLVDSHPACIVPPLPGKHRLEYITGDRFSAEFIERRRLSLQSCLDRIARHPVLQRSTALLRFLEADQMSAYDSPKRESRVFDNLGDVFLNAFSKVRKPDERFLEIKEAVEKLEQNLTNIEKMHSKMLKCQSELAVDAADLGGSVTSLGMMETQVSQPLSEFGNRLPTYGNIIRERVRAEDQDYVLALHEYAAYCGSVKDVLKTRDQKQIDNEELAQWLQSYQTDRERTMSTGKSPGITGFFKDKINDLKGVDPEKARQIRLVKLDAKIEELKEAVEQSKITSEAFSREIVREIDLFQTGKVQDFKRYLHSNVDAQISFHEKSLEFWNGFLPIVDDISLDIPAKSAPLNET